MIAFPLFPHPRFVCNLVTRVLSKKVNIINSSNNKANRWKRWNMLLSIFFLCCCRSSLFINHEVYVSSGKVQWLKIMSAPAIVLLVFCLRFKIKSPNVCLFQGGISSYRDLYMRVCAEIEVCGCWCSRLFAANTRHIVHVYFDRLIPI